MKLSIQFYRTTGGNSPVETYLKILDDTEVAPILAALREIQRYGLKKTAVHLRSIRGKLWELKIRRHRVFYVLAKGPVMVLLHACKKQGRKARTKDTELAHFRMKEVLDAD